MKLRLITPVTQATVSDVLPRAIPRPVAAAAMAAVSAVGAIMAPAPVQAETTSEAGMLAAPLTPVHKSLLHTAFASAQAAAGRVPTLLDGCVEVRDDFKRVYAVALTKEILAIEKACELLGVHARMLRMRGVRLGLYVQGEDARSVLALHGNRWAWIKCGRDQYLIYPRGGSLTPEWAADCYVYISKSTALDEVGIAIEFPQD